MPLALLTFQLIMLYCVYFQWVVMDEWMTEWNRGSHSPNQTPTILNLLNSNSKVEIWFALFYSSEVHLKRKLKENQKLCLFLQFFARKNTSRERLVGAIFLFDKLHSSILMSQRWNAEQTSFAFFPKLSTKITAV